MYSWSAFGSGTDKTTVAAEVDAQLVPIESDWRESARSSRTTSVAADDVAAARTLIARQIAELELPEGKLIKVEAYGHHTPGVAVLTHVGVWIAEPDPVPPPAKPAA
jgi:hypothetical protein